LLYPVSVPWQKKPMPGNKLIIINAFSFFGYS